MFLVLLCWATTVTAYEDNCWEWLQYRLDGVPPMAQIEPINKEPEVGDVAVMYYEKSGLTHFAVVEGIFDNGSFLVSECNMYHLYSTGCGYRILSTNYKNLTGFYNGLGR